jgi:putative transcriptional regulator
MEVTIINNVQHFRTKAFLTQEQLAEAVGVTRQTIISIEKGNYTPSVALALRLARVFAVTVEDIFSLQYEK